MKQHKTEREPLTADLIDGRLRPSSRVDDSSVNTQIARLSQLAARNEFASAAQEAASLLESGVNDIRVIGFYLFGLFLERGPVYLPRLVRRVHGLLADDYAALAPRRRKEQIIDSALAWLFQNLCIQILFHGRAKDETWKAWLDIEDTDLAATTVDELDQLSASTRAMFDDPQSAKPMAKLRRWAKNDLTRALAQRAKANATPVEQPAPKLQAPDDDVPTTPTGDVHGEERPALSMYEEPAGGASGQTSVASGLTDSPVLQTAAALSDSAIVVNSLALTALQAKLRAFQLLVDRGAFAKAAVVANDLRGTIENFDPVVYLPSLFASYFKALHQSIEDLVPYWEDTGSASWHALDQFYRADLDGFVAE